MTLRGSLLEKMLLRDNQNHARCDNQASLPAVSVVQRKLHPGIMMSGRQADVKPGPLGPASGGFGLDTSLPTERCSTIGCMADCRWTRGFDCRATVQGEKLRARHIQPSMACLLTGRTR